MSLVLEGFAGPGGSSEGMRLAGFTGTAMGPATRRASSRGRSGMPSPRLSPQRSSGLSFRTSPLLPPDTPHHVEEIARDDTAG